MALAKINFAPGIDKQTSTYGAENRWVDATNVRFRTGLPEKIGGWEKVVNKNIVGVVRGMKGWVSNAGVRFVALGTDRKLYVYSEGVFFDITPLRLDNVSLTNPFTTTAGSPTVSVAHNGHGFEAGDFVIFKNFSAIDGLDMNNEFEVTSKTDSNNFTVTHTSNASGATSGGGGSGNMDGLISVGTNRSTFGFGWSVGAWNANRAWNTPSATSTVALEASYWSLDTFGEDLLAIRNNDKLYKWDLSAGTGTRAAVISGAPTSNRFLLVSSPDRHVFLFGTETTIGNSATRDELFLRFSSQEDPSTWSPLNENSAGTFRIQDGSKIVSAVRSRGSILVWTDTALHALNNIGPPFIFGLQQVGANCGAVSPNAVVDVNGSSFWMSQTAFYMFDGAIQKLACTVQDFVFDDIDSVAQGQVAAAVNTDFNEITWFYPSNGSLYLDRSVTYNYLENTWYNNTGFARTAWIDRGIYGSPYAPKYNPSTLPDNEVILGVTAGSSLMYAHEVGKNDDGALMNAQITSGDFDIQDGEDILMCSKVIPDFKEMVSSSFFRINFSNYPASTSVRTFASLVDSSTKFFSVRGRGRQANIQISSEQLDCDWRFGTVRLDIRPDGRR
tara:strand:+ start:3007 stop:4845 length:1839 start_codon:yes stop_codon:yes gene_type:complete